MKIADIPRLLRTVRHLKSSQIAWRAYYLVERRLPKSGYWNATASHWPPAEPRPGFPAAAIADAFASDPLPVWASLLRGEFDHLNRAVAYDSVEPDWPIGDSSLNRLWTITLHYHRWAPALVALETAAADPGFLASLPEEYKWFETALAEASAMDRLARYITHWLEHYKLRRLGARNLVWNSFSIATRLKSWTQAIVYWQRDLPDVRPELRRRMLGSLARQAEYLHRHLEYDLRANHLLRDAVGLAWAGRLLSGPMADAWLATATRIAREQIAEQILPDGGHFERSAMYHVQVMEDFTSLAALLPDSDTTVAIRAAIKPMEEYLAWLLDKNDQYPVLNDGAVRADATCYVGSPDRVTPRPNTRQTGRRIGGRHFADSGLVVWHDDCWDVYFDVGPIAIDYNPAHGHADTLSIVASFNGQNLLVDAGNFAYDRDARRRYDRTTRSHNAVEIDGRDSGEVWDIFRVGRRAKPLEVEVTIEPDLLKAAASHDGYDHLPGRPRHRRTIEIGVQNGLAVTDRITGAGQHELRGGWLLAPQWQVVQTPGGWTVSSGDVNLSVALAADGPIELSSEDATMCYEYGLEHPTKRLVWQSRGPLPLEVRTVIAPT